MVQAIVFQNLNCNHPFLYFVAYLDIAFLQKGINMLTVFDGF